MTSAGQRDSRFNQITRALLVDGQYVFVRRDSTTLLVADYDSGPLEIAGESDDLGEQVRAIATDGTDIFALTKDGVTSLNAADEPDIDDSQDFNPGDGAWLVATDGILLAPAPGGVRVVDMASGSVSTAIPGMASCTTAALNSDGLLCAVDELRRQAYLFQYDSDEVTYINKFSAPNCQGLIKVIAEDGRFIIVCTRRIIVLNIDGEDLEYAGTIHTSDDITDFVAITGGYWIGFDEDSSFNPYDGAFFGRQIGLLDDDVLVVASPDFSHAGSTDTIPYIPTADFDDLVDADSRTPLSVDDFDDLISFTVP